MEMLNVPPEEIWTSVAAIVLAVFTPLIIWCIYTFRIRQITGKSLAGLAAAEVIALIAIAILARF